MEALKSYLYVSMLAALVSSVILRISDPRYRRYIRFGAGLCLLLMLTAPMISLTSQLTEITIDAPSVSEDTKEDQLMESIGQEMCKQIGDLVASRYGIPRSNIQVKLTLDLADLSAISMVRVDLTITSACDVKAIEEYLSVSLGCPVTVTMNCGTP